MMPLGWLEGVETEVEEGLGEGLEGELGVDFLFFRSLLRFGFGELEIIPLEISGFISSLFSGVSATFISSFFSAKSFPRSFSPGRSVFSSAAFGESFSFLNASEGVSVRFLFGL